MLYTINLFAIINSSAGNNASDSDGNKMKVMNAFSLNMLPTDEVFVGNNHSISFSVISAENAAMLMQRTFVESCVGHADTAALFSTLLGVNIPCNRVSVTLKTNERVLVGQYNGPRLPEGCTTLPEGAEVTWFLVDVPEKAIPYHMDDGE